jgi:hypothetical protein
MELVVSSAVPVNEMPQEVRPGAVALPCALQLIAPEVVNAPSAVPVTFSSPAHVALNAPFAETAVCSDTFQTKSVHVLGEGIRFAALQLPIKALALMAEGPVRELSRSKPMHALVAAAAVIESMSARTWFFMVVLSFQGSRILSRGFVSSFLSGEKIVSAPL